MSVIKRAPTPKDVFRMIEVMKEDEDQTPKDLNLRPNLMPLSRHLANLEAGYMHSKYAALERSMRDMCNARGAW